MENSCLTVSCTAAAKQLSTTSRLRREGGERTGAIGPVHSTTAGRCLGAAHAGSTLLSQTHTPCPRPAPTSPVNSSVVERLSMPVVPSNTCTTARSPSTSSTCPRRTLPSPSRRSTISAYLGFCGAGEG